MGYVREIRKKVGHDEIIIVGAGVIVYRDGKVLLQKRRDNGCWATHGGCVEVGERVEDAARRELFEETGLVAHDLELLGVFSGEDMRYTYPNGDMVSIVGITYVCSDVSGELRPDSEEVAQLMWFGADALPEDISGPDRAPMRAFADYILRER